MLFDDFVWQLCYNDFVINVKTFFEKNIFNRYYDNKRLKNNIDFLFNGGFLVHFFRFW